MRYFAAAMALLSFPSTAFAAEWYRVARSDGGTIYVDSQSIVREGGQATGWEYAIWDAPTDSGMVGAKTRMEVNCGDLSYRNLFHITYSRDGSSHSFEGNRQLRFAAPDTNIEAVTQFICGVYPDAVRLTDVTPEQDARNQAQ